MPRSTSRLCAALLWLALALLPLRGFAMAVMPVAMGSGSGEPAVTLPAEPMPCHLAAVDLPDAPDASHTCSLCDLCHAGVAQAPLPRIDLPALPQVRPLALADVPVHGRVPDGLFRPPRTLAA